MFDLLIRGASIVDGTGAPSRRGDIAIRGDRIVATGDVSGFAHRVIDADGLVATPGFVDIHTHYDGQASWDSVLMPSCLNGVTTIAMGNCGVGFAPAHPDRHEELISLLEGVEDIPGTALAEGLTWDWETFPEYLDALGRGRFTMDVAAQIPHAPLRTYVMGQRGADFTQHPTPDELDRMEELTLAALDAGALGFSTSRTTAHRNREGDNVGTLAASQDELMTAARALRRAGHGVFQIISDAYLTPDEAFMDAELKLIENLAVACGRPLSFSLMQAPNVPERWKRMLDHARRMSDRGLDVRAQVAPRPVGLLVGFSITLNPFSDTPTFKDLAALPFAEKVARLSDPAIRARIVGEYERGHDAPNGIKLMFDRVFRMSDPVDYDPSPNSSIYAEAQRIGRTAAEHAYDVLMEEDGRRLAYVPVVNFADHNLHAVHEMLASDHVLYGLSDGGAHCGLICDASFPTTTLKLWSDGNKQGQRIPIERLVHGYTQRNALHVGWRDRGVIAPGYLADVNVIDMDALALPPPVVVHDLPAGGTRLIQRPRGYRATIKSGVSTFENGEWTGALPGRLVRGRRAA